MSRAQRSLAASLVMAALVAGILILVSGPWVPSEIAEVLTVFAGMFAMGFAQLVSSFAADAQRGRLRLTFSPAATQKALEDIETVEYEEVLEERPRNPSWEPSSQDLLIQDPSLALAKLRIDLERELRRIVFELGLGQGLRRTTLRGMLEALSAEKILDPALVSAVHDILPVANQAVHGTSVSVRQADVVLSLGEEVLRILRGIQNRKVAVS